MPLQGRPASESIRAELDGLDAPADSKPKTTDKAETDPRVCPTCGHRRAMTPAECKRASRAKAKESE